MTKNKELIEQLCTIMYPGAIYPLRVLQERYIDVFEDETNAKKIGIALRSECKKTNSKIVKYESKDTVPMYLLNDNFNWEDEKSVGEAEDVKRMARVIYDMVHEKNKQALDNWFNKEVKSILNEMMTEMVKEEIKTEVIPLIKSHVDESVTQKIKFSKSAFRKLLLGVIADMINNIDEEIGG